MSDEEILGLLQKMIKQRNDSIEAYDKAGRVDLATQEREEKAIIEAYLPQQMSADDVRAAVKAAVAATGAASVKDMGKVMAELKGKFAGKMDFSKANAVVKEMLTAPNSCHGRRRPTTHDFTLCMKKKVVGGPPSRTMTIFFAILIFHSLVL